MEKSVGEGVEEADCGGADMETGGRTCRSRRVRRTRDLGMPQWHSSACSGAGGGGHESVCPQDVKKMLLKQARME